MVVRVTESGSEVAERCEGEGERKVEFERGYGGKEAGKRRGGGCWRQNEKRGKPWIREAGYKKGTERCLF